MPQSHTKAIEEVNKFYFGAKSQVIDEIKPRVEKEERFTVTSDEYTSKKNSLYMNIKVHTSDRGGKHFSLGMIHCKGLLRAEEISKLLKQRLLEFGMDLNKHIVSCVYPMQPPL